MAIMINGRPADQEDFDKIIAVANQVAAADDALPPVSKSITNITPELAKRYLDGDDQYGLGCSDAKSEPHQKANVTAIQHGSVMQALRRSRITSESCEAEKAYNEYKAAAANGTQTVSTEDLVANLSVEQLMTLAAVLWRDAIPAKLMWRDETQKTVVTFPLMAQTDAENGIHLNLPKDATPLPPLVRSLVLRADLEHANRFREAVLKTIGEKQNEFTGEDLRFFIINVRFSIRSLPVGESGLSKFRRSVIEHDRKFKDEFIKAINDKLSGLSNKDLLDLVFTPYTVAHDDPLTPIIYPPWFMELLEERPSGVDALDDLTDRELEKRDVEAKWTNVDARNFYEKMRAAAETQSAETIALFAEGGSTSPKGFGSGNELLESRLTGLEANYPTLIGMVRLLQTQEKSR